MSKKIMIATGGTGGHIYPSVALAQMLLKELPECNILFVGGGLEKNKYFDPHVFDKRSVSCATLQSKSPIGLLKTCSSIAKGVWESRAIIREFQPDIAVGFGSYYSIPPMIAARLYSIPLVLHEANSIPGKANMLLAPFADAIGVHFPQTLKHFKGKGIEVGMPLREGYKKGTIDRASAHLFYGLDPSRVTLLVFGGSQGARIINNNVVSALKLIKGKFPVQILHITGDVLSQETMTKEYQALGLPACVVGFEKRMDMAWHAADCVICRAGASTVAELFEFEVPGILIPFQKAAEGHQEYNADFIVKTVKGCAMLRERELNGESLAATLESLLGDGGNKLMMMRQSMKEYKATARQRDLCALVLNMLMKKGC